MRLKLRLYEIYCVTDQILRLFVFLAAAIGIRRIRFLSYKYQVKTGKIELYYCHKRQVSLRVIDFKEYV